MNGFDIIILVVVVVLLTTFTVGVVVYRSGQRTIRKSAYCLDTFQKEYQRLSGTVEKNSGLLLIFFSLVSGAAILFDAFR